MKNRHCHTYILLLAIGLLYGSKSASAQGIEFLKISYQEACEKAAKEKKNLFFDIYTTWCGPCKIMDRTVFSQKEAGDYYNSHFVSIKLDAENETDSEFFKHYKASAYPTFFWLDPDGKLLDTKTGMLTVDNLIQVGKSATLTNLGEKAKLLEKRWNDGERSFSLLQEYAFGVLRVTNPRKIESVVESYIKGLSEKEKQTIESFFAIKPFIKGRSSYPFPDTYLFKTFVTNAEHYASKVNTKVIGSGSFWHTMYSTFVRLPGILYKKALEGNEDMETYKKAVRELKSMDLTYKDMFVDCLEVEEHFSNQDFNKGIIKMKEVLNQYGADFPILYQSLLYSMIYAGYFIEGDQVQADTVLECTRDFLKVLPCKSSLMFYAAANRNSGHIETAMSAMAWMEFYPEPMLSNAYYKFFGFENIRSKLPID